MSENQSFRIGGRGFFVNGEILYHWGEITFHWQDSKRAFYCLGSDILTRYHGGDDNAFRYEHINGEHVRSYLGHKDCFIDFLDYIVRGKGDIRNPASFADLDIDPPYFEVYRNYFAELFPEAAKYLLNTIDWTESMAVIEGWQAIEELRRLESLSPQSGPQGSYMLIHSWKNGLPMTVSGNHVFSILLNPQKNRFEVCIFEKKERIYTMGPEKFVFPPALADEGEGYYPLLALQI